MGVESDSVGLCSLKTLDPYTFLSEDRYYSGGKGKSSSLSWKEHLRLSGTGVRRPSRM